MIRKTVDDPRKATQNGSKKWHPSRIRGRCYRSFRQNGDVFRRNFHPGNDLELWSYGVEFKLNPANQLRLITTVARLADCRNTLSANEIGLRTEFSPAEIVAQSITLPLAPSAGTASAVRVLGGYLRGQRP
jgi:hypothetical protein